MAGAEQYARARASRMLNLCASSIRLFASFMPCLVMYMFLL